MSVQIDLYRTRGCGYCVRAKDLLERKGVTFREIDVTFDDEKREWLYQETGRRSVPQVFVAGRPLGGYSDLAELDRRGELDAILRG